MNKNKVVEWYCVSCEKIVAPKQFLYQTPEGIFAKDVSPKTCPECNSTLQRHVTRVPRR